MKLTRLLGIAIVSMAFLAADTAAQKKPVKKPAAKKPAATSPPVKMVQPLEVRTAREKVDIQLANVKRFVEVMGPITQSVETLDHSAKTKKLPKATIDRNEETKQKLVLAIRNLKEGQGLAVLESEFRTKPSLQKYLIHIEGITDLASKSEDMALAGKFVASKDPLREVVKKLTDTLAAIPL